MRKYTERDKEVITFISNYIHIHGYSPSIREIGKSLYMSKSTAERHLFKLVELGYLRMTPKTPRSIVLNIAI